VTIKSVGEVFQSREATTRKLVSPIVERRYLSPNWLTLKATYEHDRFSSSKWPIMRRVKR